MIRYKDIILEDYSIDPVTAVITNSKGEVQKTKIRDGRPVFKSMEIYRIQVHTNLGYKKNYDIHHIDENKMNNSLSNLVYLTKSEHSKIHNKIGKKLSDETKRKISERGRGRTSPMKGKILSNETKKQISKALKGRTLSSETKNKIGEVTKNLFWITNDIENRRINKNIPIPDGFRRGRTINRIRNVGVILSS